jgi:hypothetical protein
MADQLSLDDLSVNDWLDEQQAEDDDASVFSDNDNDIFEDPIHMGYEQNHARLISGAFDVDHYDEEWY